MYELFDVIVNVNSSSSIPYKLVSVLTKDHGHNSGQGETKVTSDLHHFD